MEFRVPGFNVEMQHNQVFPTPSASSSFNYTNFSDQAMEEAIQRELEKEMIREKIIAEEVERFHVLEAEVRRELMIGREMMAMNGGMGFPSSFMPGPPPAEIRQTATSPLKLEVGKGILDCKISATRERGVPDHFAGHKHVKAASIVTKKSSPKYILNLSTKMEWRCPICEVSAPCERAFQDHLAGKKHQSKLAAPRAGNTEMEKKQMEWICPICEVCVSSEIVLQTHLAGRKHKKAVLS